MAHALITGATAGIGNAFTRLLAEKKYDLVLVARDLSRMEEQAADYRAKYGVQVEILQADLSKVDELAKVEARLHDLIKPIDVLINNAGFGLNKAFSSSKVEDEQQLLDVLVTAPMRLTHAALPQMRARKSGTVINVSSVAGWIAGGTYSAAKSYITVFSESLNTELRNRGVSVLALCPGFTHTEFHQRGQMKMGGLPTFMWLDADRVVTDAWAAAQKGAAVCIPGGQYKVLSWIAQKAPRGLVRRIGMGVRARQRR
jgi:hypothetical protein